MTPALMQRAIEALEGVLIREIEGEWYITIDHRLDGFWSVQMPPEMAFVAQKWRRDSARRAGRAAAAKEATEPEGA